MVSYFTILNLKTKRREVPSRIDVYIYSIYTTVHTYNHIHIQRSKKLTWTSSGLYQPKLVAIRANRRFPLRPVESRQLNVASESEDMLLVLVLLRIVVLLLLWLFSSYRVDT